MGFPVDIRDNEGAATIVEYAIVLPFVIMVVLLLIVLGNMTYDKALLQSAAERGALYAAKVVADPNYAKDSLFPKESNLNEIGEINMDPKQIETSPYRYLTGLFTQPETGIEDDVERIVRNGQIMRSENVHATVKVRPGLSYKVTVTVTEEFEMPSMFKFLGIPTIATIRSSSQMYVNEPAEFIRNADFAVDIATQVANATGITEKLNKLKQSISFFFKKTGGENG